MLRKSETRNSKLVFIILGIFVKKLKWKDEICEKNTLFELLDNQKLVKLMKIIKQIENRRIDFESDFGDEKTGECFTSKKKKRKMKILSCDCRGK